MALGIVLIVAENNVTDLNRVFAVRGMGPDNVTRKLCAVDPGATYETPATHRLMSDAAGDGTELAILQAMTQGDLPPLPEGVVWGEDGVISAADAMAACHGSVMQVYSCAGDVEPVDHVAAVLASRGLQFVPDPPL